MTCKRLAGLPVLFLLAAGSLSSSKVKPFNLTDITQRAHTIFEGTCIAVESATVPSADGNARIPVMRYTFRVDDGLKGAGKTVVLTQLGKFADGSIYLADPDVVGIPRYEVGRSYLLFTTRPGRTGLSVPVGLQQGIFDVRDGVAANRAGNAHILTGYAEVLNRRAAKLAPGGGLAVAEIKAMVRDLLAGRLEVQTYAEVQR